MSSVTNDSRHKRITQASSVGVDRISNLPESIISHILSLLPTEDAVATSLLSTKWKFFWRNIHNLRFDDGARQFRLLQHTEKEQDSLFGYFVNRVLLFLDRKCIDKFSLKINRFGDAHYVTIWIAAAVSRSARVIEFDGQERYDNIKSLYFDMPSSLFTCETLEVLDLIGRIKLHVPNSVFLPNVKTLRLQLVIYECDESVRKLISGCSSLENLHVKRYTYDNVVTFTISSPTLKNITLQFYNTEFLRDDDYFPEEFNYKLEINAPQLQLLELVDRHVLKDFSLENLCLLDKAKIDLDIDISLIEDDHYCKSIVNLLQRLYNVKNLSLMGNVMEAICRASFSASFPRLSELTISRTTWSHALLNILEGSTKLESLRIFQFGYDGIPDMYMCDFPEKVPICLVSCLKKMSLIGTEGLEYELAMLAYILKNAKALRTLTIDASFFLDYNNMLELVQNVSNFPRASEKCDIRSFHSWERA